jgi:hypothetical protein
MTSLTSSRPKISALSWRMGICAALGVAALAAPVGDAAAVVVAFNTPIPIPATFEGVYINLATGANAITTAAVPGWDIGPWGTSTLNLFWASTPANSFGGVTTNTTTYADLTVGSVISAASTFLVSAQPAATVAYQASGTHILGFRFFNEATSAINYGYMTIQTTGPTGFPATITGWRFENSGAAITVAAVPEPSTTAMMVLGAMGLGALQLRRRQRAGQA